MYYLASLVCLKISTQSDESFKRSDWYFHVAFQYSVLAPIFQTVAFSPSAGRYWAWPSKVPLGLPQWWEYTTTGKGGGGEVIHEADKTNGKFADTDTQGFPYVTCGNAMRGHNFPKSIFTRVNEGKAVDLISFNLIHPFWGTVHFAKVTRIAPHPFLRTVNIWKNKIIYFLIPVLKKQKQKQNMIIVTQDIRICKIF